MEKKQATELNTQDRRGISRRDFVTKTALVRGRFGRWALVVGRIIGSAQGKRQRAP
jgi:hypothetical protein